MPRPSSRPRPKVSLKPQKRRLLSDDTRFYIDYSWWDEQGRSIETFLSGRLGQDVKLEADDRQVDLIDPKTGEIRQLTGFEFAVQNYFSEMPADFLQRGKLVDNAFSVLLANGNRPMTAGEIGEQIERAPDVIFKALSGGQIYNGIRPQID